MGPKTHALTAPTVGLAAAIASKADTTHAGILIAVALMGTTFIPDGPIFLQVIVDKIKKRKLFSEEEKPNFVNSFWYIAKDITHSPLMWIAFIWLGYSSLLSPEWSLYSKVIGFGIALHWIIDLFTHTGDLFKRTDQSMIWPADIGKWKHARAGNWVGKNFWGWEYRSDYLADQKNAGKTKPGEFDFQLCAWWTSLVMIACYIYAMHHH